MSATSIPAVQTLDDLREYITGVLCEYDQLQPGAYPVTQQLLTRGGVACGVYFCLHGPRAVRYTAIWETDQNSVLFYNSSGERFQRTKLVAAPDLHAEVRRQTTAA